MHGQQNFKITCASFTIMCQKYLVFVFSTFDVPVSFFVTGKLQRPSPEMLEKFSMLLFFLLAGNSKGETE